MKKKYSMLYFLGLSLSIAHGQDPNLVRNTDLNLFPVAQRNAPIYLNYKWANNLIRKDT